MSRRPLAAAGRPRRRRAGAADSRGPSGSPIGQSLGIVLMRLGHRVDRSRKGRRKEDGLPRLRRAAQDLLHLLAEAHVQHAVGLVDDDGRDAAQIQRAAHDVIERPARRSDDHVHAQLQRLQLRLHRLPARDDQRPEGPPRAARACGSRAPPARRARAWDRGPAPAGGVCPSSASARSPGRRPPSSRCRWSTVRSDRGPPATAEWRAPGRASARRSPARPPPDRGWGRARARRTRRRAGEQAAIGASSSRLITTPARRNAARAHRTNFESSRM